MSMTVQAQKRWDWINGFLTACLHSLLIDTRVKVKTSLNFQQFHDVYIKRLLSDLENLKTVHKLHFTIPDERVRYIFHLEAELWGANWRDYMNFFPDKTNKTIGYEPLQTFGFVHAFFLLERCLELFIDNQQTGDYGRGQFRRKLFGLKDGLLSSQYPELLEVLGPPFLLCADTQRVYCIGNGLRRWKKIKNCRISSTLQIFYEATTGKPHFSKILEASFVNTRKNHLTRYFRTQGKKTKRLPRQLRAYWYDVLWNYSESVRYHLIFPTNQALTNPFYWNRSLRWFTSATITGLLNILTKSHSNIRQVWKEMRTNSRILTNVFSTKTGEARFG